MKAIKILLIVTLAVVTCLFGWSTVGERLSGENVGPSISTDGTTLEVSVKDGEEALLAGVTASDAQDGDLTGRILVQGVSKLITADTAKVSYLVFDSDGNAASTTRFIRYTDYRQPRFSVKEPLIYTMNESITLLDRIAVTDVIDGDITESVRVSALSGTSDSEVYTVSLQVTNSMGDTARVTVPVILLEGTASRPTVTLSSYLVYLDQGASFSSASYLRSVTTPAGLGDTSKVEISGQVDTATPGTYMVYYRYPYNGTTGLAVLTVVVE